MNITERNSGDCQELARRIKVEKQAKQRDRYRAVALALAGEEAPRIARTLGRSRRFVQRWSYAYRDGGIDAIAAIRQKGQPLKLPAQREAEFQARMLAGPQPVDGGVCSLRAKDAQRILQQEFGVTYTLSGVFKLLHRLGFACLRPRPVHRKNDPQAMAFWQQGAPFLSRTSAANTRSVKSKSGSRTKPGSASKEP